MERLEIERTADRLLEVIRKKPESPFPLAQLSKRLKLELPIIHSAIDVLAEWDYKLRKRRDTVTFVSAPDHLTETEISHGLKTEFIGRKIFAYNSVKSTNDLAAQMAENGVPEGTIVVADQQTKGRGRLGRSWYSPPGTGIYVSIILKPKFKPEMAPAVSIMTAIALADTMSAYCPGNVRIKWPNDVLIGGRKVAGILTELSAEREKIHHIVIGVGINVNQTAGDFPDEIRSLATSVRRSVKRKVRRVKLLQTFLSNFEKEYVKYRKHRLKKSHAKVRRYSSLIGCHVTLRTGQHETHGMALDIDDRGYLVLDVDGKKTLVSAGEVTIVKK
jgi:BirA family biotin operon repressor/biotin-[acetyl-CoA-carboxylase] ligase